jgi:hypothetical protein
LILIQLIVRTGPSLMSNKLNRSLGKTLIKIQELRNKTQSESLLKICRMKILYLHKTGKLMPKGRTKYSNQREWKKGSQAPS